MRGWAEVVVRYPWLALGAAAVLALVGGLLVAASGIMPITASSGHWPITEWFLHFSMRRSVATHALLVPSPPPDLDQTRRVLAGAGHFETGCRPCHGAPGDALPPIPRAMTPHPPALSERVPTWNARQLFYIVKHGVKFTGMPAWPSLVREDEVWSMVAFLRRLPALSEAEYDGIVRGGGTALTEMFAGTMPEATPPDIVVEVCARCHGVDGRGRGEGAFPKLAGQRLEYLERTMRAYAIGQRHSGIMQPLVSGLTDDAQRAALQYYAGLPAPDVPASPATDAARRGEAIARNGDPARDVPSCADCHGPNRHEVNPAYPKLAGQYGAYIVQQLKLMQSRHRGGSEYVQIMHTFVDRLTPEQIEDVAAYFSAGESSPR